MSDFIKDLLEKKAREFDPDALTALGVDSPEAVLHMEDSLNPPQKWSIGHPIEILINLRRQFPVADSKMTWAEWDPSVLIKHIEGKFGKLSDVTKHKIWALQVALTTDAPWQDYDIFENSCIAWTGNIPTFGVIERIDLHELAFGIGVLDRIRDEEYSSEVLAYIAATLIENGMIAMPEGCPLPNVRNTLLRLTDSENHSDVLKVVKAWSDGRRSKDNPDDIIDVQLSKFEIVDNWYKLGYNSGIK